jgi:ABC-type transporter Mla subunit MlaD
MINPTLADHERRLLELLVRLDGIDTAIRELFDSAMRITATQAKQNQNTEGLIATVAKLTEMLRDHHHQVHNASRRTDSARWIG